MLLFALLVADAVGDVTVFGDLVAGKYDVSFFVDDVAVGVYEVSLLRNSLLLHVQQILLDRQLSKAINAQLSRQIISNYSTLTLPLLSPLPPHDITVNRTSKFTFAVDCAQNISTVFNTSYHLVYDSLADYRVYLR